MVPSSFSNTKDFNSGNFLTGGKQQFSGKQWQQFYEELPREELVMRNLAILSVSSNRILRGNADFQFCRFEFDSTSCAFFFFYLLYFWCPFIYTEQNTFIDNYTKWKMNSSCISPTLHSCLLVLYHACLCGQEHVARVCGGTISVLTPTWLTVIQSLQRVPTEKPCHIMNSGH